MRSVSSRCCSSVSGRAIVHSSSEFDYFEIDGNLVSFFPASGYFTIVGSTGNNAQWSVSSSEYRSDTSRTRIFVNQDVTSATAGVTQMISQYEVQYPSGSPLPGITNG